MARITVEDCLQNVPNLFQLVLVAARRARKLANGSEATLDWEHDDHRWCNSGEAAGALRWPGTARALRELLVDTA